MVQLQTNMDTCRPWLQFLSCDWIFSSGIRFCQVSPAIQSGLFSTHSRPIFVPYRCTVPLYRFHRDCILSRNMLFPSSVTQSRETHGEMKRPQVQIKQVRFWTRLLLRRNLLLWGNSIKSRSIRLYLRPSVTIKIVSRCFAKSELSWSVEPVGRC